MRENCLGTFAGIEILKRVFYVKKIEVWERNNWGYNFEGMYESFMNFGTWNL